MDSFKFTERDHWRWFGFSRILQLSCYRFFRPFSVNQSKIEHGWFNLIRINWKKNIDFNYSNPFHCEVHRMHHRTSRFRSLSSVWFQVSNKNDWISQNKGRTNHKQRINHHHRHQIKLFCMDSISMVFE